MHADLANLFDLTGRVALVTGGSRGLGRAMAVAFANAGAAVVVASRKFENCEAVAGEITATGGKAFAIALRMNEPSDLPRVVEATVQRFGRLDILVNNAATVLDRALDNLDEASFVGAFTTNLFAPLALIQHARPHLADSGHASIINIVSIAAAAGTSGRYLYPPVKAGLAQTTRSLALDLAPQNIRVNAIAPGTFRTDMVTKAFNDATLERIAKAVPLHRIADPNEIVGPALLLASDAGSFITGTVLTVDGGATA
jgi:NAD(P)-dependent dehydrogenase (short-subunit alcohol dehydrogenase family)